MLALKILLITQFATWMEHLPAVTFEYIRLVCTQFNLHFFVQAIRSWFVLDHTRGLWTKARISRCQEPDWNWRNKFGSFCLKTSGSQRCVLRKSPKDAHRPSGGHHAGRLFGWKWFIINQFSNYSQNFFKIQNYFLDNILFIYFYKYLIHRCLRLKQDRDHATEI